MHRRAKPKKAKAEAKRPLIRKPADDGAKVRDLEKRLAEALKREEEALEQQTATSEILRVISQSPTDVQPVFDTIAQSARRLCEADVGVVFEFDGQLLHFVAYGGEAERIKALRRAFPRAPDRGSAAGRSVLSSAVEHIPDVNADPSYVLSAVVGEVLRSTVAVPMLRESQPMGTIN